MILGIALFPVFGVSGILFPLVARAVGLLASIVGIVTVRVRRDDEPSFRRCAVSPGRYRGSWKARPVLSMAAAWTS